MLLLFFCCCWFVLYIRIYENDVSQQVGWLDQLYSSCWLSLISFSCLCFPSFPVLLLLLRWMPLHSTHRLSFSAHRRKSHQHQTLAHTQLCIYLPLLLLLLSLDVSFVSWLVPSTFSRYSFDSIFIWFSFKTIPTIPPPADGGASDCSFFFFFSTPFSDAPDARVIPFFRLLLTRQPTTTTTFEGGNEINQTAMHLHFLNPIGRYTYVTIHQLLVWWFRPYYDDDVCATNNNIKRTAAHFPFPAEIENVKSNGIFALSALSLFAAHVCCLASFLLCLVKAKNHIDNGKEKVPGDRHTDTSRGVRLIQ